MNEKIEGNPSEGGSYVKNPDGTVSLAERGGSEPAVNTGEVVVPEHEEALKEAEAKAQAKAERTSRRSAEPAADSGTQS